MIMIQSRSLGVQFPQSLQINFSQSFIGLRLLKLSPKTTRVPLGWLMVKPERKNRLVLKQPRVQRWARVAKMFHLILMNMLKPLVLNDPPLNSCLPPPSTRDCVGWWRPVPRAHSRCPRRWWISGEMLQPARKWCLCLKNVGMIRTRVSKRFFLGVFQSVLSFTSCFNSQ